MNKKGCEVFKFYAQVGAHFWVYAEKAKAEDDFYYYFGVLDHGTRVEGCTVCRHFNSFSMNLSDFIKRFYETVEVTAEDGSVSLLWNGEEAIRMVPLGEDTWKVSSHYRGLKRFSRVLGPVSAETAA